jgi:hypothetical protein
MTSYLTNDFRKSFRKLPDRIQRQARKNYKLWKQNPYHPSLEFKQVHQIRPIFSVRVAIGWRALGIKQGNKVSWFWVGSHADYDTIVSKL